jgi:hypothetical protein
MISTGNAESRTQLTKIYEVQSEFISLSLEMVRGGSIYRETRKTPSKITIDKLPYVSSRSHNVVRKVLTYGV